ncbi:hypothetical protein ES702_02308 [subsurface metagenome]
MKDQIQELNLFCTRCESKKLILLKLIYLENNILLNLYCDSCGELIYHKIFESEDDLGIHDLAITRCEQKIIWDGLKKIRKENEK